jgi:hypothetical protein
MKKAQEKSHGLGATKKLNPEVCQKTGALGGFRCKVRNNFVNGQLMNAPQVNSEIESGRCSVSIPTNMVKDFLPNLDLEKIKQ